jgi:hypothetical protein
MGFQGKVSHFQTTPMISNTLKLAASFPSHTQIYRPLEKIPASYPPAPAALIANSRGVRYIMDSIRGSEGVAIYHPSICDGIQPSKASNFVSDFDLASRCIAHAHDYDDTYV